MGKFTKRGRRVAAAQRLKEQQAVSEEKIFEPELPREYADLPAQDSERQEKPTVASWKKVFIYVAGVLLASMFLAVFAWVCADDVCAFTRRDEVVTVTVEEGGNVRDLARTLKDAGLIRYKWLFKIYCLAANAENKVIPGTYSLNKTFDYHALVNGMASVGRRATISIMIPEGYECREIFALLEEKGVCTAEELWNAAANETFEYAFLEGAEAGNKNRLEGCLFPDTYEFYLNDTPRHVLDKFLRNLDNKLTDELWAQLDVLNGQRGLGLSMYEILTVASLIEKEAASGTEAGTIASVIYNRLRSSEYPFLNIDATIQYALPERKEVLSNDDKLIDSPYNTYKYMGLPAGAIANPGMTSIRGALYPQDTNYYFYALGQDGTHTFTRTYSEHLNFLRANGYD